MQTLHKRTILYGDKQQHSCSLKATVSLKVKLNVNKQQSSRFLIMLLPREDLNDNASGFGAEGVLSEPIPIQYIMLMLEVTTDLRTYSMKHFTVKCIQIRFQETYPDGILFQLNRAKVQGSCLVCESFGPSARRAGIKERLIPRLGHNVFLCIWDSLLWKI